MRWHDFKSYVEILRKPGFIAIDYVKSGMATLPINTYFLSEIKFK